MLDDARTAGVLRSSRAAWWLFAGTILAFASWMAARRAGWNEGDAAIYWTYAQSMWESGPFHFGHEGPKYGASSPLWAVVLACVRWLPGEAITNYKLAGGLALALAAWSSYRLALHVTRSDCLALAAAGLVALYAPLQQYAAVGYETPLFVALVAEAVRSTLVLTEDEGAAMLERRRRLAWVLGVCLLPLGRPEGAVFLALCVLWVFIAAYRSRASTAALVGTAALAAVPALVYYGFMFASTGSLVPSSLSGRAMMRELGDRYLAPAGVGTVLQATAGVPIGGMAARVMAIAWYPLLVLGAVVLARRSWRVLWGILAFPLVLTAALLAVDPGLYAQRYGAPALPFAAVLVVLGAGSLGGRSGARSVPGTGTWVLLALLLGATARKTWSATWRTDREIPAEVVLDRDGAERVNALLGTDARILAYEIQVQAVLDAQAISADGIVGGEILPYLGPSGDLTRFLHDQRITHVLLGSPFDYRSLYAGTILQALYRADRGLEKGERVILEGMTFEKVLEREPPSEFSSHWSALYAIDPIRNSRAERGSGTALDALPRAPSKVSFVDPDRAAERTLSSSQ